ncbi:hypothetical protein [Microbispora bryophytorum]|uniref:hypothetical protein n=1 Tax=Microbispora bryophytorum TaxID=1460882 RepID=UPI0033D011DF
MSTTQPAELACATVVGGFPPCPFDVVALVTTACAHGHVQDEPVCRYHVPVLQQGGMNCTACRERGRLAGLMPVAVVDPRTGVRRALRPR